MSQPQENTDQDQQKRPYLTFKLGDEYFAVPVEHVQEILENQSLTRVPKAPPYMLGVLNRRGEVLPVLDARLKMGLEPGEDSSKTRIIVMEAGNHDQSLQAGVRVDAAREVVELSQEAIRPLTSEEDYNHAEFLTGITEIEGEFTLVVDIHRLLSQAETQELSELSQS